MKRRIVRWSYDDGEQVYVLNCGHCTKTRGMIGDEVDCPACDVEHCIVCSSPGIATVEVEWRGHTRKVWLCQFCQLGDVGKAVAEGLVTDVSALLLIRHVSLVAHELLAQIERRR